MKPKIKVLIVHSNPESREQYVHLLQEDSDVGFMSIEADSGTEALRLAHEHAPQCILFDCAMSDVDAPLFLSEIQRKLQRQPAAVIMLAAPDSALSAQFEVGQAQNRLLVEDIPSKTVFNAIQSTIDRQELENQIQFQNEQIARLSQQLAEANSQLALVSRSDHLTNLLNRSAFEESLQLEYARSVRYQHQFGIIMMDVDCFKAFNDARGYQTGDTCLRRIAQAIRDYTRGTDFVARYGGDEFMILAPETPPEGLHILADRLRLAVLELEWPHPASTAGKIVSVSLGLSAGPAENCEQAVLSAYDALQLAKECGGNRVHAHPSAAVEPVG